MYGHFRPKGRFCQRRPEAWVPTGGLGYRVKPNGIGLKGRFTVVAREPTLQAEDFPRAAISMFSAGTQAFGLR